MSIKNNILAFLFLFLIPTAQAQELRRFESEGRFGFKNEAGAVAIPAIYEKAYSFSEGLAVVKLNGKSGYIDKTGKELFSLRYDEAFNFSNGFAQVKLNGKIGFINRVGTEVVGLIYDKVFSFSEGLAVVKRLGKSGYVDKTGREVIPAMYDVAYNFAEGKAKVKAGPDEFYIDKAGKRLASPDAPVPTAPSVAVPYGNPLHVEDFRKIEKLLQRADGEKRTEGLYVPEIITKQSFSETEVSLATQATTAGSTEWMETYTLIPWAKLLSHDISGHYGNDKLISVTLYFKTPFLEKRFLRDDENSRESRNSKKLELYALKADKAELEKLFPFLYTLRPPRIESPLNAQISKFTKQQTIDWLKIKLNGYVFGDDFTRKITLKSIDECKLVYTHSNIVYIYEETIPTNIIGISPYGRFQYDYEGAKREALNPGLVGPDKPSFSKLTYLKIKTVDEETMQNIEFALKHLASFCRQ